MKKLFACAVASLFVFASTAAHADCMRPAWYGHQAVSLLTDAGNVAREAASNRFSDTDRGFLNQEFQAYLKTLDHLTSLPNSCLTDRDLAYLHAVLNLQTLRLADADTLTREDAISATHAVKVAITVVRLNF